MRYGALNFSPLKCATGMKVLMTPGTFFGRVERIGITSLIFFRLADFKNLNFFVSLYFIKLIVNTLVFGRNIEIFNFAFVLYQSLSHSILFHHFLKGYFYIVF